MSGIFILNNRPWTDGFMECHRFINTASNHCDQEKCKKKQPVSFSTREFLHSYFSALFLRVPAALILVFVS
jgi:hypothetical protein